MKKNIKYIPGFIAIVLVVAIFLGTKFMPKQNLGSIYNIEEAGTNFDNIQIGDTINYEVNGYSDWQVIGKDDYEGTVDVVSKTNTEDLTLEPNQTKEYYENKFQETANKYIDGSHAVRARTPEKLDLEFFDYNNNFWLDNIIEDKIITSKDEWIYNLSEVKNYKIYVIPVLNKYFDNMDSYNNGDLIEYSNNGVDRWIVAGHAGHSLELIPETPIELVIESAEDDINEKANQIIQSFNNDLIRISNDYVDYNINRLSNLIPDFLNSQTERIWLYYSRAEYYQTQNYIKSNYAKYYENGEFGQLTNCYNPSCATTIYTFTNPYTLGYRPVVTLKVKREVQDKDKKEISNELQVGDYVKYEAKGYKNWKVLSIDKELGTVDIISGGIVKNLTLSGKEDWSNYEDLIQRETNEYKNDSRAIKASIATSKDFKTLKQIDKSIISRYWLLSKSTNSVPIYSYLPSVKFINYVISTIYIYKYDSYEMHLENISLYQDVTDEEGQDRYLNNITDYSYTAGLRPIITLKLDDVEKLLDKEVEKIEKETEKQERIYIKEQESKNKDYKGPSKVDDSTSSTGNNEVKTNDNTKDNITDNSTSNVEKIVYKDKPFYKYGFYILLVICLIETLLLIIPKINKK